MNLLPWTQMHLSPGACSYGQCYGAPQYQKPQYIRKLLSAWSLSLSLSQKQVARFSKAALTATSVLLSANQPWRQRKEWLSPNFQGRLTGLHVEHGMEGETRTMRTGSSNLCILNVSISPYQAGRK